MTETLGPLKSQIMTPYSLISVVNNANSCKDISNYHSPGTASAALKQGNLQALQALLNYD